MPDKVTIREDLNIIQIDSYGVITKYDLVRSLETVIRIRQEHGINKVFVDASKQKSLPPTFPVFEFASELASSVRGMKFAIYVSPKVDSNLSFLEDVAINRGGVLERFESADAALEWLMK